MAALDSHPTSLSLIHPRTNDKCPGRTLVVLTTIYSRPQCASDATRLQQLPNSDLPAGHQPLIYFLLEHGNNRGGLRIGSLPAAVNLVWVQGTSIRKPLGPHSWIPTSVCDDCSRALSSSPPFFNSHFTRVQFPTCTDPQVRVLTVTSTLILNSGHTLPNQGSDSLGAGHNSYMGKSSEH